MRNFYNFMRHFQLINWRIVIHSINELKCVFKEGHHEPSFNHETIPDYIKELKKGNVKPLPMGGYEYSFCVEYLKMIRRKLVANFNNFETITIVFDKPDFGNIVIAPLEDCLELVAKEAGFTLVEEISERNYYKYTFRSKFWEE